MHIENCWVGNPFKLDFFFIIFNNFVRPNEIWDDILLDQIWVVYASSYVIQILFSFAFFLIDSLWPQDSLQLFPNFHNRHSFIFNWTNFIQSMMMKEHLLYILFLELGFDAEDKY